MGLLSGLIGSGGATAKTSGALIKDSDTQHFMADVIQASRDQPVIVDFWAPWCGPCKQLTPLLERVVNNAGGKVRLVKINIDENPELAQQLRIQSIPTVYGFRGGQPVDGFAGALPESQIKAFVERLTGPLGPAPRRARARSSEAGGRPDRPISRRASSSSCSSTSPATPRRWPGSPAARSRAAACLPRARPSSVCPRSTPTTSRSTARAPRSAWPRRPARSPIRPRSTRVSRRPERPRGAPGPGHGPVPARSGRRSDRASAGGGAPGPRVARSGGAQAAGQVLRGARPPASGHRERAAQAVDRAVLVSRRCGTVSAGPPR